MPESMQVPRFLFLEKNHSWNEQGKEADLKNYVGSANSLPHPLTIASSSSGKTGSSTLPIFGEELCKEGAKLGGKGLFGEGVHIHAMVEAAEPRQSRLG